MAHEGATLEINECVAGLVFGAYMEGKELDELLKRTKLPRLTEFTITDPKKLRAEFERVRKAGYAVDDQYYAIGHRCIGAPIFDHTGGIAAEINISAHIRTISDDRIEALAAKVKKRAREASIRMGYTGQISLCIRFSLDARSAREALGMALDWNRRFSHERTCKPISIQGGAL